MPIAKALSLSLAVAAGVFAAPNAEVLQAPSRCVERETVTIEVAYSGIEAPARLHCEMKGDSPEVIGSRIVEVVGEGAETFQFEAPGLEQSSTVHWAVWLGEDWQSPAAPIAYTETIRILSAKEARRLEEMAAAVEDQLAAAGYSWSERGNVAVLVDDLPGFDRALADTYAAVLAERFSVTLLDGEAVSNPSLLTPERFDLLVLATVNSFPAYGAGAIGSYVEAGGHLLVLGGPAFEMPLWSVGERWMTRDDVRSVVAESAEHRVFMDFSTDDLEWQRSSNDMSTASSSQVVDAGPEGDGGALLLDIKGLSGWDTFGAPEFEESPFDAEHPVLSFMAKGDETTREVVVEIRERDGSRWMASVGLTPEWRRVAILPGEFSLWRDGSPPQSAARFRPEQARQIIIGLAFTHSPGVGPGDHQIWIDDLAAARLDPSMAELITDARVTDVPRIEGVSPAYKTYPVRGAARVEPDPRQALWPQGALDLPDACFAIHPRPQGTGFGKDRRWRFVPLLRALRDDGRLAGFPAALVIDGRANSCVISVPIPDSAYLARPEVVAALTGVVDRVMDGLLLWEGGTEYYAYEPGEEMTAGAVVLNLGGEPVTVRTELSYSAQDRQTKLARSSEAPPGLSRPFGDGVAIPLDAEGAPGVVTVDLIVGQDVVDHLEHPVSIWTTPAEPQFITASEGDFILNGEPWYAHGVNYMPSSGVGIEDNEYFEFFLDPQPYDPDVIEWDLADIEAMGMNMVSVFIYHRSLESRNLWDLLLRCRAHNLKVNLSLRPGTPMHFLWDQMRELIEVNQLAREDNVFAYDLAWEPFFGAYDERSQWDGEWLAWVEDRHGSIADAEEVWGYAAPVTDAGALTNPADEHLATDGPWRELAIDYRRFVDDLVHRKYAEARELVHSVDPNHLVSFRMTVAGDPTFPQGLLPYDLKGLAGAVDIMEPEGYGRLGDWERVKPGWFTAAYSRLVAPDTPVMWAEFGSHVWDMSIMSQSPERLEFATRFYRDFYEMALRSGANGTVCWWYPGGFRVNERSDYGIIDPDRGWRGISHVIKEYAPHMTRVRDIPEPTAWIDVEPYAHANGITGLYEAVQEEFWAIIEAGGIPGLRWADGAEE